MDNVFCVTFQGSLKEKTVENLEKYVVKDVSQADCCVDLGCIPESKHYIKYTISLILPKWVPGKVTLKHTLKVTSYFRTKIVGYLNLLCHITCFQEYPQYFNVIFTFIKNELQFIEFTIQIQFTDGSILCVSISFVFS